MIESRGGGVAWVNIVLYERRYAAAMILSVDTNVGASYLLFIVWAVASCRGSAVVPLNGR